MRRADDDVFAWAGLTEEEAIAFDDGTWFVTASGMAKLRASFGPEWFDEFDEFVEEFCDRCDH